MRIEIALFFTYYLSFNIKIALILCVIVKKRGKRPIWPLCSTEFDYHSKNYRKSGMEPPLKFRDVSLLEIDFIPNTEDSMFR